MDPVVSSVLCAQSASTASQVNFTILRKQMDVQKDQGAQIVKMIQQAAMIAPDGERGRVDLYA